MGESTAQMSGGMSADIEAWLDGSNRSLALRFPPLLEARFEADTGAQRSRTLMWFGFVGFGFCLFLYPFLRDHLPDVAPLTRILFLLVATPLGFVISASMRCNFRPLFREGLTLLANSVCTCVSTYLYAVSRATDAPLFAAGVTGLLVYSAVGIQLRFRFAVAALLIILLAYWLALDARPEVTVDARQGYLLLACGSAAFLTLANWRLERESRRSYLLLLRERLQGEDLSQQNLELDALARRDPLTGIANRRAYDSWLATIWAQELRRSGRIGLIVIDVDRFKSFNDFYGHAAGDQCLQKIALTLGEQLRGTSDLVARLGGEEFAVLLPGLDEESCADVAERMRVAVQQLELPHLGIGAGGLVTISAGIATHAIRPGSTPADLFDAADSALYEAKMSGRNRVCMATFLISAEQAQATSI